MIVHLVDGTYELFRHFYGLRRFTKGEDRPLGAVVGVLQTVLRDDRAGRDARRRRHRPRHRVVPQRPVARLQDRRRHRAGAAGAVPSARGGAARRWASSSGRWSSSRPTMRWPRRRASPPPTRAVEKVCIWTPDKDLAQCVRGDRVVQVDRKRQGDPRRGRRAREVRRRAGADPRLPGAGRRRRRRLSRHRRHRRRSARRGCSTATARSKRFRRRCSASSRRWRCCSSGSRRCAPMRRSFAASRSCAGAARRRRSPAWTERAAAPRLLERSRAAAGQGECK